MDRYNYSQDTISKSRDLYRLLVADHRPQRGECLTYGEAGAAIGMHVRPIRFALHKIQDECIRTSRPVITTLVVKKQNGLPGEGCVASRSKDFERALHEIAKATWPDEPWW